MYDALTAFQRFRTVSDGLEEPVLTARVAGLVADSGAELGTVRDIERARS